jgi:cytochrome P450
MATASTGCPHLEGFNPLDPAIAGHEREWFARARREAPIFFMPEFGFWAITRYDDVLTVLKDPETFSSANSPTVPDPPPEFREQLPNGFPQRSQLAAADPPEHTRLRRLAQKAFSPRLLASKEGELRAIAAALVAEMAQQDEVDVVECFCDRMAMRSITSLLGAPLDDERKFRQFGADNLTLISAKPPLDPAQMPAYDALLRSITPNLVEYNEYVQALLNDRRSHPREDIISELVRLRDEDDTAARLTDDELIGLVSTMIVGGIDTTAMALTHTIMVLQEDRSRWERLKADPSLAPAVWEETLRIRNPGLGPFRLVTRDTTLSGVALPAGSMIWMLQSSANNDESMFPNPDVFDIERENLKEHVGLGRWTHFCLGAPLARMEGRVALEELVKGVPELELVEDQELTWVPSMFMPRLERVLVRPRGRVLA